MKIAILGAGESGAGAAVLAKKKGFEVFVSDAGTIKDKYKKVLLNHEIRWEEGKHSEDAILNADEVIKSPGIPDNASLIVKLRENEIPVISEIEFAARYTDANLIGITGSNGKTTTTLLTHYMLTNGGLNAGLAGNVGQSFALQVATEEHDYYVLELSSFQLDGIVNFRPDIAVLLNITPDHLDRYDYKLQNYINSKFRITENQTPDDAFIYCIDDENIMNEMTRRSIAAKCYPFSIKEEVENGAFIQGNQLITNINQTVTNMSIEDLALQGKHNLYNSMAASIVARLVDLRKDVIRESLSGFQNIEHRMEFVATIHGIDFINDSKATNVNSTWYALENMQRPVIWIVGGVDKGNDYSSLKDIVSEKVKGIICLGKDNKKIIEAFEGMVDFIAETGSAVEAVQVAYQTGTKGDVVLLSPACASFDLFDNYEDRGRQFKEAVKAL